MQSPTQPPTTVLQDKQDSLIVYTQGYMFLEIEETRLGWLVQFLQLQGAQSIKEHSMRRILLCSLALSLSPVVLAKPLPDPSMPTYHIAPPLTHVKYPSGTGHPGTHPLVSKQRPVQTPPTVKAPPLHAD